VRIEDYGLIGDMQAAALVGRDGAVDWLCLPRFDSPSCFSALLGDERHGRWRLAPAGDVRAGSRRYRPGTLVLENDFKTAEGAVRVIDFMPRRGDGPPRLMRIVEGLRGRVPTQMEADRRAGTIHAITRELGRDGFVSRYSTADTDDGLAGREGQFLACSFWLVSALALSGRVEEARALFERLLDLRNDLGLLAEEYDVERERQVGNFPQAFSHLTLIGAATAISAAEAAASGGAPAISLGPGDSLSDLIWSGG
jgi:GH15 family glucan-1,4-alpha-glucosidase